MKKIETLRGGIATPLDSNFIDRVVQGVKYVITGVGPNTWFGPAQPMLPASPESKGRRLDYPFGYNIQIQPRAAEGASFLQMRALSDNYDILRLVIETRKDQIARLKWKFMPREDGSGISREKPSGKVADNIKRAREVFEFPDLEHNWDQWLRLLNEDMLVIDAATIYPRKTRGGQTYAFEIFDGATITRKLNVDGRTPEPPDVAYQQILKGIPAVDYSRDELIYFPRNPRSWKVYGYSPVEQIMRIVNIALRRMLFQLAYYTEGNVPEALIGVPETWTMEQIAEFQTYWDNLVEGNLAVRRHARFVPGEISKNVHETKGSAFESDGFADEWLARIVCYCFSVSPQPFVKMMNRATAESSAQMAQQEGLEPLLQWSKNLIDLLLWKYLDLKDIEFSWQSGQEPKPYEQAQIDEIYVRNGIKGIDDVRARIGSEPLGIGPFVMTASGPVLVEDILSGNIPSNGNGGNGKQPIEGKIPEEIALKLAKAKKKFHESLGGANWYGQPPRN